MKRPLAPPGLLLLCLAMTTMLARPARVDVAFTVNSTLDAVDANPGDGIAVTAGGQTTLRAAIQESNALPGQHTINLPAGTYALTIPGTSEDAAATGDLDVTGILSIRGAGAGKTIIDANNLDAALDVIESANLGLTGVTIRNGLAGINSTAGEVVVTDCVITGNFLHGIQNTLGLLLITNTAISGNVGTGINAVRDAAVGTSVVLISSKVTDNFGDGVATGRSGGLEADYTTISDNSGNGITTIGGIIHLDHSNVIGNAGAGVQCSATVSGIDCLFRDNGGGGILALGGSVTLDDSTIDESAFGLGGFNADFTVSGCTVSDNGVAISLLDGSLALANSTVIGSTGSGLDLSGLGAVRLVNLTVSGNALQSGAGMSIRDHVTAELENTILAGSQSGPNCIISGGTLTSLGHNLSSDASCAAFLTAPGDLNAADPLLGPLSNNGGPTQTQALLPGSPAIDAGNDADCPPTDQRGIARPQDGDGDGAAHCDIGAYELIPGRAVAVADLQVVVSDAPDPVAVGGLLTYTLTVTNHGPDPATGVQLSDPLPEGVSLYSTPAPFEGEPPDLSFDLGRIGSGESKTITVTVVPGAPGTITSTPTVTGNETDPNPQNNSVTEPTTVSGGGECSGKIAVSAKRLRFGSVRVKHSRTRSVTVRNRSKTEDLHVSIGEPDDPFTVTSKDTDFTLGPGQRRTIRVRYAPDKRGKDSSELEITSSDCKSPSVTVGLSGSATRSPFFPFPIVPSGPPRHKK